MLCLFVSGLIGGFHPFHAKFRGQFKCERGQKASLRCSTPAGAAAAHGSVPFATACPGLAGESMTGQATAGRRARERLHRAPER